MNRPLIKVCGMRDPANIREVEALGIDWMGFICWKGSKRYVPERPSYMPTKAKRVGVFVDAPLEEILQHIYDFGFDLIQLHGHESPDFCRTLRASCGDTIGIIKAFSVANSEDLAVTKDYENQVDYFLFDTRSSLPGGSGQQFDWNILDAYEASVPFLLSGGIGPEDASRLRSFNHPRCMGFDLNSRFETAPAHKDISLLSLFLNH